MQHKIVAIYLYSTEIMLRYKKGDRGRRLNSLRLLSESTKDETVKSYIYYYMARIFKASPYAETHYAESVSMYAKKAFDLNMESTLISQFLSTLYYSRSAWDECLYWSQMAIACLHGDIPIYLHNEKRNICYAEHVDSLNHLGLAQIGVIIGRRYQDTVPELKNKHKACFSDNKVLEDALKRCEQAVMTENSRKSIKKVQQGKVQAQCRHDDKIDDNPVFKILSYSYLNNV